jgi:hypothetical protein
MPGISVQLGALWNRSSRSLSDQTEMSYQFRTQTNGGDSSGMVARDWMGRRREGKRRKRGKEKKGEKRRGKIGKFNGSNDGDGS